MANLNLVVAFSQTGANTITGALGGIGHALGDIAKTAAGFALGGGITELPNLLKDAALAAADDAASVAKLQTAVTNSGVAWSKYADQLDGTINAAMKMGFTDDQTRDSLSLLIAQTGSATEAQKRYKLAMDLARGANIDVVTASKLLGKVTDDNVSVLSRYGIVVQKGASEAELFGKIQQKFGGQADAFAQSTKGQMEAATIAFSEMKESLGYAVLPLLTRLGSIVTDNLPAIQSFVELLGQGLSAGVDLAFRTFDTLWGILQPVTDAIGSALPKAWEAAQAVIAAFTTDAGALGIVLGDIRDVFGDTVANAIEPFVNLIADNLPAVQAFVGTLQDLGSKVLAGDFSGALDLASQMLGGLVDSIKTWASGDGPRQIADALVGLADSAWSWVTAAAQTAADFLDANLVQPVKAWVDAGGIRAVADALVGLADGAWDWIKNAAATAAGFLDANVIEPVKQWVKDGGPGKVADALVHLADQAWDWVLAAKDFAIDKLGGLVDAAADWVKNGGLANIVTALSGLAAGAWDWVLKAKDTALEKLGGLVDGVKAWVADDGPAKVAMALFDLAQGAWDWVQEAVKTAAGKLGPILGSIRDWVTETGWPETKKIGERLGDALLNGINAGLKALIDAGGLQPALDALAAGLNKVEVPKNLNESWVTWGKNLAIVSGWIDKVNAGMGGGTGTNALMNIANGLASIWVAEFGIAAKIANDFATAVYGILTAIDRLVRGKDNIKQAMQDIGDLLGMKNVDFHIRSLEIGEQIVSGLIEGLTNKFKDLEATAESLANIVPDWMKKIIRPGSPSRLFHEYGISIGEGLIEGIGAEIPGVAAAAANLTGKLVQVFQNGQQQIHGILVKITNDYNAMIEMAGGPPNPPHPPSHVPPPGGASGTPNPGGGPIVPGGLNFQGGPNTVNNPWNGTAGPAKPGFTGGPTVMGPYGPYIPSFDLGGMVPGPAGAPMLAVVHGRERVLTADQAAGQVNHFYGDNYFTGPSMLDALSTLSEMTR